MGARVGFLACLAVVMLAVGAPTAIAKVRHHSHHLATALKAHHHASGSKHTPSSGRRHPTLSTAKARLHHPAAVKGRHHASRTIAKSHQAPARRRAQLCQQVMSHGEWVSRCR